VTKLRRNAIVVVALAVVLVIMAFIMAFTSRLLVRRTERSVGRDSEPEPTVPELGTPA